MIKLSGNDVTFGENTVSQSGQRLLTKSGIRGSVLSGKRTTGFHWNGHRFPPPPSGSVLYYPGYPAQGSVIQDFSGEGNDGTIIGALWRQTDKGPWYVLLDGSDDRITCSLAQTQLFTFQCWLKKTTLGADDNIYNTVDTFTYMRTRTNGSIVCNTYDGANNTYATAGGVISAGTWCLVTNPVDIANDSRQIYVNDTIKKDDTTDINNISALQNWLFGTATVSADAGMALIRIYNKKLSATEIAGIYQSERHLFGV